MKIAEPLKDLQVAIDSIKPREGNPRQGDLEVIKESLEINGQYRPIVINQRTNEILAGNHTYKAAKELGWPEIAATWVDADEEEAARIVLVDNRANDVATYDQDLLAELLQGLESLEGTGFNDVEIEELLDELSGEPTEYEGETDADEVPEEPAPEEIKTKLGDVWQLGPHRVMCGDSTNAEHVALLMDGEIAALMHADPPYGMGKEGDGVLNDNLYRENLDKFQMAWWETARPYIADNGSAYIWGNAEDLWRLWYAGGLKASEKLTFRNEIVWDKEYGLGMASDKHRMYPTASERCIFFIFGEQGFNTNKDNYWKGWDPLRVYLREEMDKCGGTSSWRDALGNGMGGHYFTTSQWVFPTAEAYAKLKAYGKGKAFKREYEDLKREYEDLKREYEDLKREFYKSRAFFDNTHDKMTDVWRYDRVLGDEREGHATPKPVTMMERIMLSSLPSGGLCLEPFGGSGSTLIGAERTGRRCFTMELDPSYCDVIVKRWEEHTGKTAQKAEKEKEEK